jgi:hypothetical protein
MGSAQQRILQYNLAYHDLKVIHSLRTSFMQLSTIWAFVANRKPWSHGGQCWDSDLEPCLPLQDNLPSLNVGEITCFEPIFKCDVEKRIGVEGLCFESGCGSRLAMLASLATNVDDDLSCAGRLLVS